MNPDTTFPLFSFIVLLLWPLHAPLQQQKPCTISNSLFNYTFDLSSTHLTSGLYHIKTSSAEYSINPCADPADPVPAVTRTSTNTNTTLVYGYNNRTTLSSVTSHILLSYEGN
jgi:hypothetical protein